MIGGLTFYALAGSSRFSGPVILDLDATHGVHRDDLVVVGLAAAGLALCWLLRRRP